MAPKGLQYCDILLRVPLSAAEVHSNGQDEEPEIDEIFCQKLREVLNTVEKAKAKIKTKKQKKKLRHVEPVHFEETKEQKINSPQSPSTLDICQPKSPIVSIKNVTAAA